MTENVGPERAAIRIAAEIRWRDPNATWSGIAERVGVSTRTLERWRKTEEWEIVFREAGQEYVEALAPTAVMALRKAWARGNANGALEVLRSFGFLKNERIEIEHPMTVEEIIVLQERLADTPE